MSVRNNSPYWRHDAYTLRRLQGAVIECIQRARQLGGLCPDTTVVDLGCGDAPYKDLFVAAGANYLACDLQSGPQVDLVLSADGSVPLPDSTARCVTSFQVLEHVWDLDLYLSECRRLLEEDGLLILTTHGSWLYHPHPADFRRWTRDGLERELSSRGFSVIECWSVVGPLAWTTQFRTLAYHHVFQRLGLPGRLLSAAFCALMYLRMSFEDMVTPSDLRRNNAAVYVMLARPVP